MKEMKKYFVYATSPKENIWHLRSRYFFGNYKTFNGALKIAQKFGNCFVCELQEDNALIEICYSLPINE